MVFAQKPLLIKNNKKREAVLKNEAGGDEKRVFFYLALENVHPLVLMGLFTKCKGGLVFENAGR